MKGVERRQVSEERAEGVVVSVAKLWWIKVNTKPVRTHALDGAVFPHMIRVRYGVGGAEYTRRKYVGPFAACPRVGDRVAVRYRAGRPSRGRVDL